MSTPDNQSSESVLTLNHNENPPAGSDKVANAEVDAAAQPRQEGRTKQMEKCSRYDEERDKPSQLLQHESGDSNIQVIGTVNE
ncbi:hypothetical protein K1719_036017 [Acacia pycnantha]|nr:hypothetical protein K1719_036017 [Acacia pycnantha]